MEDNNVTRLGVKTPIEPTDPSIQNYEIKFRGEQAVVLNIRGILYVTPFAIVISKSKDDQTILFTALHDQIAYVQAIA